MFKAPTPYHLRAMRPSDVARVMEIEVAAFPVPWKASAYHYEITHNRLAHYQVLTVAQGDQTARVVGYSGFWMLADEAHISTIAVDPAWTRRGLGELLLLSMLRQSYALKAQLVTLEVRTGNVAAQGLYAKFKFRVVGRRRRYYQGKEDALIMTAEPLDRRYRAFLAQREKAVLRRLGRVGVEE